MNHDKQYQGLVKKILELGNIRPPARAGMEGTIGIFGETLKFVDVDNNFPLLTTKEMSITNIAVELIWFLKGETNIKYLVENKCYIWNGDAYKYYKRIAERYHFDPCDEETFIQNVLTGAKLNLKSADKVVVYTHGDLGKTYGRNWRSFGDTIDQIKNTTESIQTTPFSRYHVVTAWNPIETFESALPPCHILFQFYVRYTTTGKYLDMMFYMRSIDTGLGLPYNIASYGLLLLAMANKTGCIAGDLTWFGGDTHIYENHVEGLKEQLTREPFPAPIVVVDFDSEKELWDMKPSNFLLRQYESHSKIKLPLCVGV